MQRNNNILIADDHFIVRNGLEIIVKENFPEYNLYLASNYDEIISVVCEIDIDLIILDVSFEKENSINFIENIISIQNNIKILIYSGVSEKIYLNKLLQLKVLGFLSKNADKTEIINAITKLIAGETYFSNYCYKKQSTQNGKSDKNLINSLSKREFEIMLLLIKGEGNLEISTILNIKPTTISTIKKRIFEKLKVQNISELIELYEIYK